jgi:hypothetical protein
VRGLATFNAREAVPRALPLFDLRCGPTHLDQALSVSVRELKYISHPTAGEVDTVDALGEFLSEPYAHLSNRRANDMPRVRSAFLGLLAATCTVLHRATTVTLLDVAVCVARDGRHVGLCLTEARSW